MNTRFGIFFFYQNKLKKTRIFKHFKSHKSYTCLLIDFKNKQQKKYQKNSTKKYGKLKKGTKILHIHTHSYTQKIGVKKNTTINGYL